MKLNEIFDPEYYDVLQDQMKRREFDRDEDIPNDTETSIQDFIISRFEAGDLTYDEALTELKKNTPADQMYFYKQELDMADELRED